MWNRSVAEAEGAEKAMQTRLRERPTYLGQVQKQVPRGSHHRAWSADFTLRLLRRKIQEKEKVWPKTSQDQACRSRGAVQARGEAPRDELPSVPSSWASYSHPANSSTTGPPVNLGDSGPRGSTFGTQEFHVSVLSLQRTGNSILRALHCVQLGKERQEWWKRRHTAALLRKLQSS